MKKLIVGLSLLYSLVSFAGVDFINYPGKVVKLDQKTVTLEIMGTNYKFIREKLGKEFATLKKGETVYIQVPGAQVRN
ncbi:MAG: hypothetical protein JNL11_15425 [Bdellovibrionaceae bacterium]|nr:hypothetical protein [Pseudobdellovibrionaceae bacterium]